MLLNIKVENKNSRTLHRKSQPAGTKSNPRRLVIRYQDITKNESSSEHPSTNSLYRVAGLYSFPFHICRTLSNSNSLVPCFRSLSIIGPSTVIVCEIFPFSPSIKVDQCLHTAPFSNLSFKPNKIYRLCNRLLAYKTKYSTVECEAVTDLCQEVVATRCQGFVTIAL